MPLTSYLMVNNLNGLLPCIGDSIRGSDFFIMLPIFCFSIFYTFVGKQGLDSNFFLKTLIFIVSIAFSGKVILYAKKTDLYKGYNVLTITKHFALEPLRAFKELGIINFWIYQITSYRTVSTEDKKYAEEFIKNSSPRMMSNVDKANETNKNLIIILVESFQSWLIDRNINGIELTPHINQLLKEAKTVYFPKEMPQVKDGRSSDAQLIINTGLLPLETGAASSLCSENTFPSLPEALRKKGYTSVSLLCDDKAFWNQATMTDAYHFNFLYDHLQGNEGAERADENLFKQATTILKQLKQPFYAQIVTLSSHPPYLIPITSSPLEKDTTLINDEIRHYMIAAQYVDKCINDFINNLKACGLYDNSIVIITGDHEAITFNQYEGREELKGEDCFVPFIILNSPLSSQHTNQVIGQIDIYPSLLDIMGCQDYYFTGLGESVFCDTISRVFSSLFSKSDLTFT